MPIVAAMGGRSARALGLGGNGYLPQANALIARMSPKPLPARESVINRLIATLIGAGVWQKLDVLQVYAADAQANALLNWISSSYNASVVNTPTFATDRGFTSVSGTSSYVRSGYTPSTGPKWGADDHCFGRWLGATTGGGGYELGAEDTASGRSAKINTNISGPQYIVSDSGADYVAGAAPGKSLVSTKTTGSSYDVYKDGIFQASQASSSKPGVASELIVGAYDLDTVISSYSPNQVGAIWMGAALSGAQVLALHDALQAYMTAVGA